MMRGLKPCPFCGSTDIVNDDAPGTGGESLVRYAAKCRSCGVSFWHPDIGGSREGSPFDWNTRPIEDALRAELSMLKLGICTTLANQAETGPEMVDEVTGCEATLAPETEENREAQRVVDEIREVDGD